MERFEARVDDAILDDLRARLARTRWSDAVVSDWSQGTPLPFLQRLCAYWADGFEWRAQEARLNALPQFRAYVDGVGLHLVHARAAGGNGTPLLISNGWPSSIFEYVELIPRLSTAGFDVVAPTLPGYGWSDRPTASGMTPSRIAALFARLMTQLGYDRFIAHGSDMGAGVVERLRQTLPERLLGAHFSNVYWGYPRPPDPTPEEERYFAAAKAWQAAEGAYAMSHATKPQTLASALNDSPAGLAAWIVEKFQAWSDGDAEQVFGLDGLCTNLTVYWATQTIGSSMRLYAESFADSRTRHALDKGNVPVGVIVFPKDILPAPRSWGERWLNLAHWTEPERGGHFPGWETPELLAEDLALFRDSVRP